MLKRIVLFCGLVALVSSNAVAKFPFGRRTTRSASVQRPSGAAATHRVPAIQVNDPVKMTELYGPSILVRKIKAQTFVKQPG